MIIPPPPFFFIKTPGGGGDNIAIWEEQETALCLEVVSGHAFTTK